MLKKTYASPWSFKSANIGRFWLMLFCALFFAGIVGQAAETNYVVPPGTPGVIPTSNYTSWATAATNIQDAIDAAGDGLGNAVFITNGHYYLTGALYVAKTVLIRSCNNGAVDPANTIIDANNYDGKPAANQCIYIYAGTIEGLTFTNGVAPSDRVGGGCYIRTGATMTNCIITGNSATNTGWLFGGGIYSSGGTIANCRIVGNSCTAHGAGIYVSGETIVKNCFIAWNWLANPGGNGIISFNNGGYVYNCDIVSNTSCIGVVSFNAGQGNIISNCTIRNNFEGFGIDCYNKAGLTDPCALITDCRIIDNDGGPDYGGGVYLSRSAKIRNSLIANNVGRNSNFGVGVAIVWNDVTTSRNEIESCTIVSNYSKSAGAGLLVNDGFICFVTDTIIANNKMTSGDSDISVSEDEKNYITNSCCPTYALPALQGNIQADPKFVDGNGGNYRLASGSPCIDTGLTQDWMANAVDLDGRMRVRYGCVDMGAYEHIREGTIFSVH